MRPITAVRMPGFTATEVLQSRTRYQSTSTHADHLDAVSPQSCNPWEWIACAGALAGCAVACATVVGCAACLAAAGASQCLKCVS
jgi:hypothetical protein